MISRVLETKAFQVGEAFSKSLKTSPSSHTLFLVGLDFAFGPNYEVVIVGDLNSDETKEMLAALRRNYIPNMVVIHRPIQEKPDILSICPFIKNMGPVEQKATAFVCHDYICELPTNDIDKMLELLGAKKMG